MGYDGRYEIKSIPNLRGGLNDADDPAEIGENEMADCENYEVTDKSVRTAGGYVLYDENPQVGPFWGGLEISLSSGTQRIVRQRGSILEYDDGAGNWTACTLPTAGSPAATVVLSQVPNSMVQMNDIALWSNGFDVVMSSADGGITWVLQSSLPKSKILFDNGLNRIVFLAQPASPAANFQFIGKNDGQDIVDAVLLPTGGMILFKTYRFYGFSDISQNMIGVDPLGEAPCVPHTAKATENSVIWAGHDGIYEYGAAGVKRISGKITRSGRNYITTTSKMCAVYHNSRYRLSMPNGSGTYNAQEYIVHRNLPTGDPEAPYVITRNVRYIGCYIREQRRQNGVLRARVYFGDSRPSSGSPATTYSTFAWINDEHDPDVIQGLGGAAQSAYYVTKFFNEKRPFFIKRYVRKFLDMICDQNFTFTLSYRFDPYASWTDVNLTLTASDLEILYEDGNSGPFSEGYAFSYAATSQLFADLERIGDPRGVQFKVSTNTINDVTILGSGYKYLVNSNFR
jgi:hypothetical protein